MNCQGCGRPIVFIAELGLWLLAYPFSGPLQCGTLPRHRPIGLSTIKRDLADVLFS